MLRKPDDAEYRPYKRKALADPPSSNPDDDIRPNLSLYQQRKPEPYGSQASAVKPVMPSRGLLFVQSIYS